MRQELSKVEAVLFDLDGVLTNTAKLHAAAWKEMFDEYLQRRAEESGAEFVAFDIAKDYKTYIDGKLRQDGVRSFLESRGVKLPEGKPDDPPGRETIHGLGNRKNALVLDLIQNRGVEKFEDSVKWAERLRQTGVKTAVVSASRNCRPVLEVTGLTGLFDVVVDGVVARDASLSGKPAPDTFLAAARKLAVSPLRAAVIEDAIAGVQAGRAGGFGLVIGVDREGQPDALREAGADIVVKDLSKLG